MIIALNSIDEPTDVEPITITGFAHYGTDRVQGDTPRLARDLVAGDVLRAYSGIQDTITVTSVEREMGQGCRYSYTITFSDTTISRYVDSERRYDLATGGPRP